MYRYKDLIGQINYLKSMGVIVGSIGKSFFENDIPYVYVGDNKCDKNQDIIVTGGIHAREHISSYCVMAQVIYTLNNYISLRKIGGGIYFVPMLNPDGNEIAERGESVIIDNIERYSTEMGKSMRELVKNSDHRLYKANGKGVDLNTNFDAMFGCGKQNIKDKIAIENYVGECHTSECETKAICEFTKKIMPLATISYHAKGRELYYKFNQSKKEQERDYTIATKLNQSLDYKIVDLSFDSCGGYKDYCIDKFSIPSFTIELCSDELTHPIDDYSLCVEDIKINKTLAMDLLAIVRKKQSIGINNFT